MKRPIENNSSPGQAVYEPFSGSGLVRRRWSRPGPTPGRAHQSRSGQRQRERRGARGRRRSAGHRRLGAQGAPPGWRRIAGRRSALHVAPPRASPVAQRERYPGRRAAARERPPCGRGLEAHAMLHPAPRDAVARDAACAPTDGRARCRRKAPQRRPLRAVRRATAGRRGRPRRGRACAHGGQ